MPILNSTYLATALRTIATIAIVAAALFASPQAEAKKKFRLTVTPEEKDMLDEMRAEREQHFEHDVRMKRLHNYQSMKNSGMLEFVQARAQMGASPTLMEGKNGAIVPAISSVVAVQKPENRQSRQQTQEEIDAKIEQYLAEARAKAPKYESVKYEAEVEKHPEELMSKDELLGYFNVVTDGNKTTYTPKAAASKIETNDIFLFFEAVDGKPGPLTLRVLYYADDPLNIQRVDFQIDGEALRLVPMMLDKSHRGRYYSERFMQPLTGTDTSLAQSMGRAHYVRAKFIGKNCNHIKDLSKQQVINLRRAYFLHKALSQK